MNLVYFAIKLSVVILISLSVNPVQAQTIQLGNKTVVIQTTAIWDGADATDVSNGAVQEGTPTDFVPLTDGTGRFLVSTLGGTVHVLDKVGQIQTLGSPLLSPEQTGNTIPFNLRYGLNGFALHPEFAMPDSFGYGKAYGIASQVFNAGTPDFSPTGITANNHQSVLFEYDLQDIVGDVSQNSVGGNFSRREILRIQQDGGSHNVVDLAFRSNGEMYLTVGDGTANSLQTTGYRKQYAQNLDEVYGKVLRFSPDPDAFAAGGGTVGTGRQSDNRAYSISDSNPFYDGAAGSNVDEVYANGVRSPYRINIDPNNEDVVWLGDVGEGNREEVNRIVAGGNYGWGIKEGTANAPSAGGIPTIQGSQTLIDPAFEYSHSNRADVRGEAGGGISVIGGFIYRGTELGQDLQGQYLGGELGNFFDGGRNISRLFYADPDASSSTQDPSLLLLDRKSSLFNNLSFGGELLPNLITSIGEDLDGELWVLGLDATGAPGIDEGDELPGKLVVARIRSVESYGDFDLDSDFDGADFLQWQRGFSNRPLLPADLAAWQDNFGTTLGVAASAEVIPEPAAGLLILVGMLPFVTLRKRGLVRT